MENTPSPPSQNLTNSQAQLQRTSSAGNRLLFTVVISVLLTAIIIGSVVYFWQKSANEKAISNLEQKISSLEKQVSAMNQIETVPTETPSDTSVDSLSGTPTDTPVPTVDSAVNWQIYTNTKYKYSLEYPSEYKVGSCRSCFDLSTADFVTLTPPQKDKYGVISVSHLRDRKSDETLEQYLEDVSTVDANPIVPGSKKRLRVGGYEALATITKNYGYESKNVFVTNGNTVIHFSFSGVAYLSNSGISLVDYKNIDIFEQILSTFKFTD